MKTFKIERFSYARDEDDDCISAQEIQAILNKFENRAGGTNVGFGTWKVEEIKENEINYHI